tara:strand:+ start:308 stop:448 length:141 start_codon:yes stop_codon:yes gene_type:complete
MSRVARIRTAVGTSSFPIRRKFKTISIRKFKKVKAKPPFSRKRKKK